MAVVNMVGQEDGSNKSLSIQGAMIAICAGPHHVGELHSVPDEEHGHVVANLR